MNDDNRGKIINREYAKQIKDFSGLKFGKITPTDIDAFIDFQNKAFVFIEAKYGMSDMPRGQELAIERICDACQKAGIQSLGILASHNNSKGDINFSEMKVVKYRRLFKWELLSKEISVRVFIDMFIGFVGIEV